jgi:hypothetical protein
MSDMGRRRGEFYAYQKQFFPSLHAHLLRWSRNLEKEVKAVKALLMLSLLWQNIPKWTLIFFQFIPKGGQQDIFQPTAQLEWKAEMSCTSPT